MLCASCGQPTERTPCAACGREALLAGRYTLLRILGRGATGVTYEAISASGTRVAIKEQPLHGVADLKGLELLRREAKVLSELDHPSIPRLFEQLTWGDGKHRALYLVQSLIEGQSLAELRAARRFTEREVLEIVAAVAEILEHLHALHPPIVHRDIKPGNLMRQSDGRWMLIDFGAVRDTVADPALGGSTIAGTFGYMAPEQLLGHATPATDLYGLGATALALLTGGDPSDLASEHGRLEWRAAIRVSAGTEALLSSMLDPEVTRREASAASVARQARRLATGALDLPVTSSQSRAPRVAIFAVLGSIALGTLIHGLSTGGEETLMGPVAIVRELETPSTGASRGDETPEERCADGALDACAEAGRRIELGIDAEPDRERATAFFRRGCDRGHALSCAHLTRLDPGRIRELAEACSGGGAAGCLELARAYDRGAGLGKDEARAMELFDRACANGAAEACHAAAARRALVAPERAAELRQHAEDACARGEAAACVAAGVLLDRGAGVEVDRETARHYYGTACQDGFARGCANLAWASAADASLPSALAVKAFEDACAQGDAEACAVAAASAGRAERRRLLADLSCAAGSAEGCRIAGLSEPIEPVTAEALAAAGWPLLP